jgi:hypothetical protein
MPTPEVLREIRRATRPHGVARGDAFALSPRQLDRCCATGVLERFRKGVFIDPVAPDTPLRRLAAAVAAGGDVSGAWGRSAAALWGLTAHPATPEIVIPYRRALRLDDVLVRRSRDLRWEHLVVRNGIRTLDPMRAVVGAAAALEPVEVAELIVEGTHLGLFSPDAVDTTIGRLARPGRNGITVARKALELAMIGDRPAESVLELRFVLGPGQCGIPPYVYQLEVRIGRRRFYIDFAYPEVQLAIEVDGYDKRRSRASLDHDVDRQNLLSLAGWTFLRFTWPRIVHDPGGVAAEIIQALGRLGYRFGG